MSTKYLSQLLYFANEDLPQLSHDLVNASTLYTQQAALQRMHNILTYLVHTAILNAYENGQPSGKPAPAPAPAAQAETARAPAPPILRAAIPPGPLPLGAMAAQRPAPTGGPVEVFVTPQGSRAHIPGMPVAAFPPGTTVDTAQFIHPAATPFPPPITADVILPQGGGLSPEVAAALAGRSSDAPMMDASGARNITHEAPP